MIDSLVITTGDGTAVNILNQCISIELYESVNHPFMSGILVIRDAQDLINKLPIIGNEAVDLKLSTGKNNSKELAGRGDVTAEYSGQFRIYKLNNRTRTSEREMAYTLHFISPEAYTDINKKVSRAYQGAPHEIINEIVTKKDGLNSSKKLTVEESTNKIKFISNFWSPKENIDFVARRAVNKASNPSYVFFETKDGFNFVTLDSLYDVAPYFKWTRDNYTREVMNVGGDKKSTEDDNMKILTIENFSGFNYLEQLRQGMYGSEIIYYDLTTQQYVHTGYQPDWNSSKHLNEQPLSKNTYAVPKSVLIHGKQAYNNFNDYGAETAETKTIQKRNALLAQAEAIKCTITVKGDLTIKAGQKVNIVIPPSTQVSDNDDVIIDKFQSGNYIINSVCHQVTTKEYTCILDLTKDSHMEGVYADKQ